jgi:hypothetical protein
MHPLTRQLSEALILEMGAIVRIDGTARRRCGGWNLGGKGGFRHQLAA